MKKIGSILFAVLSFPVMIMGQGQRVVNPNDTLKSVRQLANGDVVLSIYAPQANQVELGGDIIPWNEKISPVKEDNGIWRFTVPHVSPSVYRYYFVVDGVNVYDPKDPLAEASFAIACIGKGDEFFAMKDVPHGAMAQRWYYSKNLKTMRRLHVWTPAGYEKSSEELPVLYLIHGGGDTDISWPTVGRAGYILDNLMAEGKIKPMVVVMPNGSVKAEGGAYGVSLFEEDLVGSILPFIEDNYRVKAAPQHRALAGLSMGGMETLETILNHYDRFTYYWVLSSGWWNNGETYPVYQEKLNKIADGFGKTVKQLVFTMGGQEDFAWKNCQETLKLFDKAGIKYRYSESPGGHSWYTWRNDLYRLSQELFK